MGVADISGAHGLLDRAPKEALDFAISTTPPAERVSYPSQLPESVERVS